jgi:hypothetical protein
MGFLIGFASDALPPGGYRHGDLQGLIRPWTDVML